MRFEKMARIEKVNAFERQRVKIALAGSTNFVRTPVRTGQAVEVQRLHSADGRAARDGLTDLWVALVKHFARARDVHI